MTEAARPKRRSFNDADMLASLICEKLQIPLEHQKEMTFAQVRSLVHGDHYPIPFAEGGPTEFWNCTVLSIIAHRIKTATIDIPQIAKGKRIRNREIVRRFKAAAKADPVATAELYPAAARLQRRTRKIANRPFSKQHRPLRSRNNLRKRS